MNAGWQSATLKDLCVVDWGNTKLTKSAYVENGQFLAVSAAGCDGRIGHREHAKHTPVLSAIGAQCGKMFFPEEDYTAIKNTITLTPRDDLCSGRFLYYLLTFVELPQRGAGQPFISKGDIQSFPVEYPPLPEQHRIVVILDEAFESIANAKSNAEKNLQNVHTLLESQLQSVFTERKEGWEFKLLGDICKTGAGGTPLKSKREYYEGGDVPWLLSGEVSQGEITVATNFITQKGLENSSAKLFPANTVLVAMYGATAGQVGILRFEASTNQAVCGILPSEHFLPEFLFFFFLHKKEELVAQAAGNAQPNISQIKIRNMDIPVVPLTEQQLIVAKLNALRDEIKRLESLYQRKLTALDDLKKSLLYRAFNGAL